MKDTHMISADSGFDPYILILSLHNTAVDDSLTFIASNLHAEEIEAFVAASSSVLVSCSTHDHTGIIRHFRAITN